MPPSLYRDSRLQDRPDITGLRAVAVFLVLLYHLGTPFSGGFVGVDVFFVISGYLITSVILADLTAGSFSFLKFYERRIRRILPALLAMLIVSTVLAWRYLTPAELEAYGRSQCAALFSFSNIFFHNQAGYFASPSTLTPLLHTWSLAVEEQFYIVFPLLIVLIYRTLPRLLALILCILAAVSFVGAAITVSRDANSAFFYAPLRAWELLIGAILARGLLPRIHGLIYRNVASTVGLALILWAALRYTGGTPFPGAAALAPCVGAALIIAAGETGSSVVGSMLSLRPVVFLGLISYSIYLWHWPLLVFQRTDKMLFAQTELTPAAKVLFIMLVVIIASASWFFIEQPIRRGRLRPAPRVLIPATASVVAMLAITSIALRTTGGFPGRFPLDAQRVGAYTNYDRGPSTRDGVCYVQPTAAFADFHSDPCLVQHRGRKAILLAGDSHAAALYPGLAQVFQDDDILQANVSSCRASTIEPADSAKICVDLNSFLFGSYLTAHHVDTLLLAARWSMGDFGALRQTIQFAHDHGIQVVVVGPSIEFDQGLPRILAVALRNGDVEQAAAHRDLGPEQLDAVMAKLAVSEWRVPYISIYQDLCTPVCPLYAAPEVPLLFDSHHFTAAGAALMAKAMLVRHQLP
jgi:peptidoglycan/LPS O-acetylase OafA/YrhL